MNQVLPTLKMNSNTTSKEKVIHVLSETWPLNGKEIYNKLVKEFSYPGSYQSVHKTLQQLILELVVEKNAQKYSLSKEWIRNLQSFGNSLYQRYFEQSQIPFSQMAQKDSFSISFSTPMKMGRFLLGFFSELIKSSHQPIVIKWFHAWPLTGFSDQELIELQKIFTSAPLYIVGSQFTTVDRLSLSTFESFGAKITEKNLPFDPDTVVFGDFVINVYFENKRKTAWHKMCVQTKKTGEINLLKQILAISEENFPITVLANRSSELAKAIRHEVAGLKK